MNKEQTSDIFLGRWLTMTPLCTTGIAYPVFYRYLFLFDSEVDLLVNGSRILYKHDSLWCQKGWSDSYMWLIARAQLIITDLKFLIGKSYSNILISYTLHVYKI